MKNSNSASERLFEEAKHHLVGGVNSPVRAFGAVGGVPRFISRAKGALLFDADGKSFIDYVGSWGPMIWGHAAPIILSAVKRQLALGVSYGAPCEGEIELAKLIKDAFPSIELLRFTSSGTEATMAAIRLARAATRRARIIKFEGGYHGHSDGLLVAAGSGATTFGVPSSAGVPDTLAKNTWVLPYNDVSSLENLFAKQGPNIAAVIVEPVAGNMGVVVPTPAFVEALSRLAQKYGALLIYDEVMTGFRLAWGGAQTLQNIRPDLTCLGKILGGGFPVGAFGGRRELMEMIAPLGPVYQAGTLSGNPVAMAAGIAALTALQKRPPYAALEKKTAGLCAAVKQSAQKHGVRLQINQMGSMFTIFFSEQKVDSYFSATQSDTAAYGRFFHALLKRGVYLPPSQFEAAFVSAAHTPDLLAKTAASMDEALSEIGASR